MRNDKDQLRTIAIIVALVVAFAFFIWLPGRRQAARLNAELVSIEQGVVIAQDRAAVLPAVAQRVLLFEEELDDSPVALSRESDLSGFLTQLNHAAAAQGLMHPEVTTRPIADGPDCRYMPITLTFSAGFEQAYAFLRSIETLPRLTRVSRFRATRIPNVQSDLLEVQMEVNAFFKIDAEDAI